MQTAYCFKDNFEHSLNLPDANEKIMGSLQWGKFEEFFTPAYWYAQTWFFEQNDSPALNYTLGRSFEEEVVACLLGGYGIPSELGNAKFRQFQQSKIFRIKAISYQDIEKIMTSPVHHHGKDKKYRFAKQKAKYIYDALEKMRTINETSLSDRELRDFLLTINGIGPKTASWIVRNYRNSDDVAILDIHLYRAGLLAGFFDKNDKVDKHYFNMEDKFLAFCNKLDIKASILDAVIWRTMKELNKYALSRL
ncbi:hypothetical protein [Sulfurovum sp.]|uniref:8-oxoguanine DNA glycosylase n=1 Tax=Sulfurovum sp. TaxID=1969726 RepID=UPI0035671219